MLHAAINYHHDADDNDADDNDDGNDCVSIHF